MGCNQILCDFWCTALTWKYWRRRLKADSFENDLSKWCGQWGLLGFSHPAGCFNVVEDGDNKTPNHELTGRLPHRASLLYLFLTSFLKPWRGACCMNECRAVCFWGGRAGRAGGWVCCVCLHHSHPHCRTPRNMWWGWSALHPPLPIPCLTTLTPKLAFWPRSPTPSSKSSPHLFSPFLPPFSHTLPPLLPHQLDPIPASSHELRQVMVQTVLRVDVMSQRMPCLRFEICLRVLSDQRKHKCGGHGCTPVWHNHPDTKSRGEEMKCKEQRKGRKGNQKMFTAGWTCREVINMQI